MIDIKNESIEVSIENQKFDLPFLWLRDNCQCDECRITETQEKQFLQNTLIISAPKSFFQKKAKNLLFNLRLFQHVLLT